MVPFINCFLCFLFVSFVFALNFVIWVSSWFGIFCFSFLVECTFPWVLRRANCKVRNTRYSPGGTSGQQG